MNNPFETRSPEATRELGEKIGRYLQSGDIVLLFGDLGAGKTTLIQGIARGLGVSQEEYVRSPSFTLINEYRGKFPVYHIDLYRLDTPDELDDLGLEELLAGPGVTLIEWGEKLLVEGRPHPSLSGPGGWLEIHLRITDVGSHLIEIYTKNLIVTDHPIFALH